MVTRKLNKRKYRRNKRNTRQRKGKKQTPKLIKCEICSKSKKISRKKLNKLRNAGWCEWLMYGSKADRQSRPSPSIQGESRKIPPEPWNYDRPPLQTATAEEQNRLRRKRLLFAPLHDIKKGEYSSITNSMRGKELESRLKVLNEYEAQRTEAKKAEKAEAVRAAKERELRDAEKAAKIVAERVAANWIDPRARVERVLPKFMQRLSRKKKNIKKRY